MTVEGLMEQLRALSRAEHDDLSIGNEAAAMISMLHFECNKLRALLAGASAELQAHEDGERSGMAQAYQVIGGLAEASGLFDDPNVIKAMDYFSKCEFNDDFLPWHVEASQNTVTRFEVIDQGRELVKTGVKIELLWQDEGRTLKVVVSQREEVKPT